VSATSPVRFPDASSREVMTRRGWILVVLNLAIPGSAQLLAGNRKLGRFGVGATFLLWAVALVAVLLWFTARYIVLTIATNGIALIVVQAAVVFYVVLWIVLTLDALRLVRLVRTGPSARGFIAAFAVLALVGVASGAGYAFVVSNSARGLIGEVFSGGQVEEPIDGRYNILLLGGDAGPDRLGLRPDSISVVSIDAETGAATIIGIPRNLQRVTFAEGSPMHTEFPTGYDCGPECLVSYLYTYGEEHPDLYPNAIAEGSEPGIEAMRDAASGVTGLELQYYVLIDMQGFSDLIDALGGVDIDSPGRYPIGGSDGSDEPYAEPNGWIEPGEQHMDGFTALWYARSRHGTSDYDRMQRQRQVQEAILTQMEPANVLTKFEKVASAGSKVVSTDIPSGMLAYFVETAGKTRALPVEKLNLVPQNGVDVIHPDFTAIHAMVDAALAHSVPSPSPSPDGK
jgi:polyisoprenyl-teichoic acid--peptidoglycan teichoic acid transferase